MSATFYQNESCPYFPCHEGIEKKEFSCMFCFCPLYMLQDRCGGKFTYTENGIKDCSACDIPHREENYDYMVAKAMLIVEMTKKKQPTGAGNVAEQ